MSTTRSQFTWSPSSFLTGVAVTLDASTILSAYTLWHKLRASSRHPGGRARYYYLLLGLIALAHACDMCIRTAVTALTITDKVSKDTGDFVYRDLTAGTLVMNLVSLALAWAGGVGFVGLNAVRFRAIAKVRMPMVVRVVSGLAGVSMAVCSVNNGRFILFAYGFIGLYKYGEASSYSRFMESLNHLFSGWSIYDSVINALISLAFVTYLQRMLLFLQPTLSETTSGSISSTSHLAAAAAAVPSPLATPKSDSSATFAHLLNCITWILGFECSAMIASNIFVQVAPTLDPLWNSIYLSESIRLRLFCTFFVLLNRMVGESRRTGHKMGTDDEEAAGPSKMGSTPATAGVATTSRPSAVTIPLMPLVPGGNASAGNNGSGVHSGQGSVTMATLKGQYTSHSGRHEEVTQGGSVLDQAARQVYGM